MNPLKPGDEFVCSGEGKGVEPFLFHKVAPVVLLWLQTLLYVMAEEMTGL
jgi:hypothetical protein